MTQPAAVAATTRGRRIRTGVHVSHLLASCMALLACSGGNTGAPAAPHPAPQAKAANPPAATNTYASRAWGFRLDVPPGWTVRQGFPSTYLADDAWKTFADEDSRGEPVLSLAVPGSNRITDAEIRIGASRVPVEVQRCTAPPTAVVAGSVASLRIDGVPFTTFQATDAAMSHHLDVHAYRAVHHGACYAIDLLVLGVNPEVYDPPVTPPFTDAHAFASMRAVIRTLEFEQPSDQPAASASTSAR